MIRKLAWPRCARSRILFSRASPSVLVAGLGGDVDDDVLDRPVAGDAASAVDHVLTEPTGLLLRMRRHDQLVDVRLELGERVADRGDGVTLDDEAVRGDALVAQHRHRPVEPSTCRGAPGVLVDDVAALGLVHGADHRHAQLAVAVALDGLDQLPAGHGLVGDD